MMSNGSCTDLASIPENGFGQSVFRCRSMCNDFQKLHQSACAAGTATADMVIAAEAAKKRFSIVTIVLAAAAASQESH